MQNWTVRTEKQSGRVPAALGMMPAMRLGPGFMLSALTLLFGVAQVSGQERPANGAAVFPVDQLQGLLDQLVADGKTPAVFAGCGGPDGPAAIAASGVRKLGQPDAVTTDDLIHIGSCTKAMTAVLIARLVEQGKLHWDDTIAFRLPQLAAEIDAGWHDRTLVQLLSHTAGVPRDAKNWVGKGATVDDKRRSIITAELGGPPAADAPAWDYSNLGVMIAGQMAAEAEGMSWEDLIRREVFEPLGMASAGFGPPGQLRTIEQPFGHSQRKDGKFAPVFLDNPPPLGPAGRVHLSLADWLRFTAVFCGGGPESFLSPATLERLTTPVADDYALGWGVTERDWSKGTVLQHNGSNGLWMAACWVAPATGRSYVAVVNHGGEQADAVVDQVISRLIALDQ